MAEHPSGTLDVEAAEALEKQYDSSLVTRDNGATLKQVLYYIAIAFAFYHIYTAGFGTPVDHEHMGVHLSGLFILIFAGMPLVRTQSALEFQQNTWWRWGNVPIYDWVFAALGISAALFLALSWTGLTAFGLDVPEQALRQGDPHWLDLIFGTALIVLVLEITRRGLGVLTPPEIPYILYLSQRAGLCRRPAAFCSRGCYVLDHHPSRESRITKRSP